MKGWTLLHHMCAELKDHDRAIRFFHFLLFFSMIVFILSLTGCMGLVARSIKKGDQVKYSELKESIPQIQSQSGRLFVYLVDGGPNPFNTVGIDGFCTLDENVYELLGKTFWYIDLPIGRHKITVDVGLGGWGAVYKGDKVFEFDLAEGDTLYCRMDLYRSGLLIKFKPVFVKMSEAEPQLAELEIFNNFNPDKKASERRK